VQLSKLFEVATAALLDGLQALLEDNVELAREVIGRKEAFNGLMESAYGRVRQRLLSSDPHRLPTFQVEVDSVHLVQRIFYFARRTARLTLRNGDA
jgi:phosphate:Na+ symporter